jgi:cysteine desulfurase NifS
MTYGPLFRLREKLVEPVGEARNDYLIMAELAARLGYGERYPQSEEDLLRHVLEGSGFTLEQVRDAGGQAKIPSPMTEYKKWEKGGLRPDGQPGFDTPTGRFEIHSTVLEDYGYEPLPKYTEPTEGPLADPALAERYPLVFNSGARPQTDFRSQHHGIEGLVRDHPEPTVDINPADAQARDIASGDLVEVSTPRGAVAVRARVTPDIVAGAVECSMGGGGPVGPKAWRTRNVNVLTDLQNHDEISGFPVYKALLCQLEKVEEGTEESRAAATLSASGCEAMPELALRRKGPPARRIHLDNNATTRVAEEVGEAMQPYLNGRYGNPSSIHGTGRDAREAVEGARRQVARLIGTKPRRIVFTGSGSEADNLALIGLALARRDRGRHLVTSRIEHPAVLKAAAFLERQGFEVSYLDVDEDGLIDPDSLRAALRDDTLLVSVMLANNEVGTVQPIAELAGIARERGVPFHTDAVQAAGKLPLDVDALGVDMLSLSGHKLHAPKGVGALFVARGLSLEPLVHGGSQEGGLRAGTENVPGIVGFGRAAELARRDLDAATRVARLRDRLEEGVRELVPEALLNGHRDRRLPNTVNLTLPGLRGESLVVALDQHGISIASGSACKSGNPEPTHVLLAMGRSREQAHCAVRFSLARETREEEIQATLEALGRILQEMESTVRFLPCK